MSNDLLYQISLTLLPNIGDVIGKKLVSYCGGVEAIFKEKKTNLLKIPGIGSKIVDGIVNQNVFRIAEAEIAFIEKHQITPLFYLDKAYPWRLKQCVDNPILLYTKGNLNLNAERILAVVGTRRITDYGKEITEKIVKEFAGDNQVLIVSGLAYGVDSAAHKAAVDAKIPTAGVLAHGLDRIYPAQNAALAKKMLENGGWVSDYKSGTNPDRENFPSRNRIIAGLADAVLVIEAAEKGGALITAEIANSYNRDVFAVPGRTTDLYSIGCNNLIRQNKAALVQGAGDIRYFMNWMQTDRNLKQPQSIQKSLFVELSANEKTIYDILSEKDGCGIDEICISSNLSISKAAEALLNMEFAGILRTLPGKIYRLI